MRFFTRREREAPSPGDTTTRNAPSKFNFTRDVVEAFAHDPLLPALTFVDRDGIIDRRTFADVALEANRWAGLLRSRGLRPGDRLLVVVGKTPAWHAILLGALKVGVVAVPCPQNLSGTELAARAERSGARLVVAGIEYAPKVARMAVTTETILVEAVGDELATITAPETTHDTAAADTAFIVSLRSSAGARGVPVSHASTWAARRHAERVLGVHRGDTVWCTGGTGRATTIWNGLLGPMSRGAESVVHDGPFDVEQRLELVRRLGVTVLCQDAAEYRLMVEGDVYEQDGLVTLRHAVSVGEPLGPELVGEFRDAFGITVHEGNGPAEFAPEPVGLRKPGPAKDADDRPSASDGENRPSSPGDAEDHDPVGAPVALTVAQRERETSAYRGSAALVSTEPTIDALREIVGRVEVEVPPRKDQHDGAVATRALQAPPAAPTPDETVEREQEQERASAPAEPPSRREAARRRRADARAHKEEARAHKAEERQLAKEQKAQAEAERRAQEEVEKRREAAERASATERRREEEEHRRREQHVAADHERRKADEQREALVVAEAEPVDEARHREPMTQADAGHKRRRGADRLGRARRASRADALDGPGERQDEASVDLGERLRGYGRRIPERDRSE